MPTDNAAYKRVWTMNVPDTGETRECRRLWPLLVAEFAPRWFARIEPRDWAARKLWRLGDFIHWLGSRVVGYVPAGRDYSLWR